MTPTTPIKHLVKGPDGLYRYQRRVPKKAQPFLGRTVWNTSLGRDEQKAVRRCQALQQQHDDELARLETTHGRSTARIELGERIGAPAVFEPLTEADFAPGQYTPEKAKGEDPATLLVDMWRRAPDILRTPHEKGGQDEVERLWGFWRMAFAFPPPDPIDRQVFDAYRAMFERRIEELAPSKDPEKIKALAEKYIENEKLRPNTARSYREHIARFADLVGDLPVKSITTRHVQDFRERLKAPNAKGQVLEATTISRHFSALKAVLTYAVDERLISSNPATGIRLPKDEKGTEERKHLSFSDEEAKAILTACEATWAPTAKTRLTPLRRKAFLWAVKALAYTGMRPHEFFALEDDAVTDDTIDIRVSKSMKRIIPLPAKLKGLAAFVRSGGLADTRNNPKIASVLTDNFTPIIRGLEITEPRKTLYSWRATVTSRMRNAEPTPIPDHVIRGIIGHAERGGKLAHYSDRAKLAAMAEGLAVIQY